jgi:hypothetical protein
VIDGAVLVSVAQAVVGAMFIGADRAIRLDVLIDNARLWLLISMLVSLR